MTSERRFIENVPVFGEKARQKRLNEERARRDKFIQNVRTNTDTFIAQLFRSDNPMVADFLNGKIELRSVFEEYVKTTFSGNREQAQTMFINRLSNTVDVLATSGGRTVDMNQLRASLTSHFFDKPVRLQCRRDGFVADIVVLISNLPQTKKKK